MGDNIGPKSRKSVPGGYPKMATRSEDDEKRGGGLFDENGLQDGGQNRQKVDKKVIQNLVIF